MFSPNIANYATVGVKSVFAQDNINLAINQSQHLNYKVQYVMVIQHDSTIHERDKTTYSTLSKHNNKLY